MPIPELRPYQKSNLAEIRELWRTHQSVLYQSQTGSGKGTVASWLTHKATLDGRRVLFIVDRRALVIDFSENRLTKQFGLPHGVIMGSHPSRPWEKTHVASIDTLCRRLDRLPKADIILVDEARASSSPKWVSVLSAYPKTTKILGFDATPQAPGGRGLGRASGGAFDALVHGPSTRDLIAGGYLVPGRILHPVGMGDKSKLRMRGDDFTHDSQVDVCATRQMIGNVVDKYQKHANGLKTVFFGVDQNHCREVSEELNAAGIKAAYVGSDTPDDARRGIWADYDNGTLLVICSYGVTAYGWDHPITACVILGRPVGNMPLLRQLMGRGARPYPGKREFIVIDHWDSCKELDVAFDDDVDWQLDGKAIKSERDSVSMSMCIHCRGNFRTGPRACPYCGVEIQKKIKEVESVEGELEEFVRRPMTAAEWQAKVQGEARYKQLRDLYEVQTQRGYKKGYATMAFKSMFGYFPPKDWMKLVIGEDATQMEITG